LTKIKKWYYKIHILLISFFMRIIAHVVLCFIGTFITLSHTLAAETPIYTNMQCGQPIAARTAVGQLEMITPTASGCIGPMATISRVWLNMFADDSSGTKKTSKILLDLAQKDIVGYRTALLRAQQIRYANAIRSVRVRAAQSKTSETTGYLIKNAPVKVMTPGSGWSRVKSGKVVVTDTRENTLDIDTSNGTSGYTATRYLRDATPSDLIQIGQADIAYWSDITHTRVAHLVNIRLHPWYTSPIVRTISHDIPLYRVATIDNWSEVESMDGKIHGFIRSDYLVVDQSQLIEIKPLLY
jgi:hypothetical protein